MAVLFLRGGCGLLLTMLLHYTYNVWPQVLALVLPQVHVNSHGPAGWISTTLMVTVTAGPRSHWVRNLVAQNRKRM